MNSGLWWESACVWPSRLPWPPQSADCLALVSYFYNYYSQRSPPNNKHIYIYIHIINNTHMSHNKLLAQLVGRLVCLVRTDRHRNDFFFLLIPHLTHVQMFIYFEVHLEVWISNSTEIKVLWGVCILSMYNKLDCINAHCMSQHPTMWQSLNWLQT